MRCKCCLAFLQRESSQRLFHICFKPKLCVLASQALFYPDSPQKRISLLKVSTNYAGFCLSSPSAAVFCFLLVFCGAQGVRSSRHHSDSSRGSQTPSPSSLQLQVEGGRAKTQICADAGSVTQIPFPPNFRHVSPHQRDGSIRTDPVSGRGGLKTGGGGLW